LATDQVAGRKAACGRLFCACLPATARNTGRQSGLAKTDVCL